MNRAETVPDRSGQLQLVEQGVRAFTDELRTDVTYEHPYVQASVSSYLSIVEAGGKRTRGALTICAYEMHGGDNMEMISTAAGVVEALHAYLLVVDDVADKARTRRGKPAAHVLMEDFLTQQQATGDVATTAAHMAIFGALAAQHKAQSMLAGLDIEPERKQTIITKVNNQLVLTNFGQVLDVASTSLPMTEDDILTVARYKTAYYSFELPLGVGAVAAGAPKESLRRLADYSMHAGLAFQLQDDVIGIFEGEDKTGKPANSDIVEGKKTLLTAYAMEAATPPQQAVLLKALGNEELSLADFEACKEVLVETGALERVRALAARHVDQAHGVLDNPFDYWRPESVRQLHTMAAFVIKRDY